MTACPIDSRMRHWPAQLLILVSAVAPAAALANTPEHQVEEMSKDAEAARKATDLLIVPIPQSNPSIGTGLTLVGALLYEPEGSGGQPWITGAGALYTTKKSWAAGAFHKMSLADDQFRVMAFGGYGSFNLEFFGIGPNAGERGVSVDINQKGVVAILEGTMRVVPKLHAGARALYLNVDTTADRTLPAFPDLEIPPFQLNTTVVAVGPSLDYDTRDDTFAPTRGTLINAQWLFSVKDLGSDFSYNKLKLAANFYHPLSKTGVMAARLSMCGVSENAPFFDLCLYGQFNDLRGYQSGQYRDRASWAAQIEFRQHLGGRFGGVIFAGMGGIAPKLSHIDDSTILPAVGGGLRFQVSEAYRVNMSLDVAIGKDSSAVYFSVGEAF